MTPRPTDPLYLVDASIYIFQAWFSPHYEVLSKDGRDLSAFFGFAQFLNRFLRQTRPRSIAIAFDESLFCGFRHTLYPAYKANRELPDEELARQLHACAALAPDVTKERSRTVNSSTSGLPRHNTRSTTWPGRCISITCRR